MPVNSAICGWHNCVNMGEKNTHFSSRQLVHWTGRSDTPSLPACQPIYIRMIICTQIVQYPWQGDPEGADGLKLPPEKNIRCFVFLFYDMLLAVFLRLLSPSCQSQRTDINDVYTHFSWELISKELGPVKLLDQTSARQKLFDFSFFFCAFLTRSELKRRGR